MYTPEDRKEQGKDIRERGTADGGRNLHFLLEDGARVVNFWKGHPLTMPCSQGSPSHGP